MYDKDDETVITLHELNSEFKIIDETQNVLTEIIHKPAALSNTENDCFMIERHDLEK